jgi:hypothetical protein
MLTPFKKLLCRTRPSHMVAPSQPVALRRRWVETTDGRCPIACVWFALPTDPADSEETPCEPPQLAQPVFSFAGGGRQFALYSSLYGNLYPVAL